MNKCWLTFILLCYTAICSAKEYELSSKEGQSFTIVYDSDINDDKAEISFTKIRSRNKLKDIDIVFFEKKRVYNDGVKFKGRFDEVRTFEIPSGIEFTNSNSIDYFLLSRKPKLSFTLSRDDDANLAIPMYIVKKVKEKEYKLLEELGELKIELCKPKAKKTIQQQKSIKKANLIVDNGSEDEKVLREQVYDQIDLIKKSLEEQTELPFSDMLKGYIEGLREYKKDVEGKDLRSEIDKCLRLCERKEKELKEEADEQAKRAENEAKKEKELILKREQVREDSIKIAERTQAAEEKKQNMWLVIGGAILAVLCFIGNQVFQHFRNIRNQRSMMEMQQDIARRAEYEAKRHTQNAVRKKTNEVVNNTRKATDKLVSDKLNKSRGKNSTKFSI